MKTLQQIEPRTPISSAPYSIISSGSYYLTNNLTVTSGNAITISAENVTVDLNGFTISSTEASPAGTGIYGDSNAKHVHIFNGHIRGNVTYDGSSFSGPGFFNGIYLEAAANARVSGVSVAGCRVFGIYLSANASTLVESCTIDTAGGHGISAHSVSHSTVFKCGGKGIDASTVETCYAESTANGIIAQTVLNSYGASTGNADGIQSYVAVNCRGYCAGIGSGVSAENATNCQGISSVGYGVSASNATNCEGFSQGSNGVFASHTAQGCRGTSNSSNAFGVRAQVATNCHGFNNGSGTGLYAERMAAGCYGESNGSATFGLRAPVAMNSYGFNTAAGTGLYGEKVAIGCYGFAQTGTGLSAFTANSCRGEIGTSGTPQAITNKYNMP